jgi:hypothetical protein
MFLIEFNHNTQLNIILIYFTQSNRENLNKVEKSSLKNQLPVNW